MLHSCALEPPHPTFSVTRAMIGHKTSLNYTIHPNVTTLHVKCALAVSECNLELSPCLAVSTHPSLWAEVGK